MAAKSNGAHSVSDQTIAPEYSAQHTISDSSGTIADIYPDSSVARLLDSPLAHKTLKYGVEILSFAIINMFFPKRASWMARVALPLAVNYVLGKWIEDNYDEWVMTLAQREGENKAQRASKTSSPAARQ